MNFVIQVRLCIIVGVCALHLAAQQKPIEPQRVLLLLPFDSFRPVTRELILGLEEGLRTAQPDGRTVVHVEFLRQIQSNRPENEDRLFEWLRQKYRLTSFTVICPVRSETMPLAGRLQKDLWPSAQIVFLMLKDEYKPDYGPGPGRTGVVYDLGEGEIVESALALLPGTTHVALVGGSSPQDLEWHERYVTLLGRLRPGLQIIEISRLSLDDTLARLQSLPEKSIIFLGHFLRDATGRSLVHEELVPLLSKASNRPVFTGYTLGFGSGSVGGPMSSILRAGEELGKRAARAMQGQDSPNMPIGQIPFVRAVDWRELRKWNIPESRVPQGTEIRFRELSVWEEYRLHAVAGLGLVLLQALVIAILLAERRKRISSEREARESGHLSRAILSSLSGRIAILDAKGAIVSVKDNWSDSDDGPVGFPDQPLGVDYLEAISQWGATADGKEQVRAAVEAVFTRGERTRSAEFRGSSGEHERWVGVRVERLGRGGGGAVVMHRDITREKHAQLERRRALEELYHMNRVATVGQLAGSLAHELAQPLASIMSNAQAGVRFLNRPGGPERGEVRDALTQVVEDDRRARTIIDRMRAILKKQAIPVHEVDLNRCVEDVARLVRNVALMRGVQLHVELAQENVLVIGDEVPLQQVVLNLLNNAMDAVQTQPRGARVVTVSTHNPGRMGEVIVEDSGSGIPEEVMGRLFDSFFTTKPDGLGMGLSICRSIAESLGGRVSAANRPNGGAVFRVALPAADAGLTEQTKSAAAAQG